MEDIAVQCMVCEAYFYITPSEAPSLVYCPACNEFTLVQPIEDEEC